MNKILIIGYQHSGTTLLSQLFQAHPQVSRLYNEAGLVEFNKPMEEMEHIVSNEVYPDDNKGWAWGDKIPWIDGNGKRIIKLSKRWLKYFRKKGRIVHILRHPLDVSLSINPSIKKDLDLIHSSMPAVIDYINSEDRATTILYEDLVLFPRTTISKLYSFCGLTNNKKTLNRILNTEFRFGKMGSVKSQSRAYAYKRTRQPLTVDYDKLINMIKE